MPTTENITVLFTDLVGSTELSASLTPEAADDVRRRHFSALRQAIAASGGTEVKNLGDGLMVVFPVASAALGLRGGHAAGASHRRQRRRRTAPRVAGRHSARARRPRRTDDYFGDPVIEAARLCAQAEGGQILVADLVRAIAGRRSSHAFTPLGVLELKGLPEPIETLQVGWEPLGADGTASGSVPSSGPPGSPSRRRGDRPGGRTRPLLPRRAQAGGPRGRVARSSSSAGEPGQGKTTLVV